MKVARLGHMALAVVMLLAVNACGGGATQVATGGIGGTGITQGTVTGFGSIWVNGVEFTTTSASFDVDGTPGTQSDLRIGMVVTVDGSVNTNGISGVANAVTYAKHLQGPISALTIGTTLSTLNVLGQTVYVDNLTKIYDAQGVAQTVSVLKVNENVQVSGYLDASGYVRATYIEIGPAGSEQEVQGVVSSLLGSTFNIGSLTIDASGVSVNGVSNGSYVEVTGTLNSGQLVATNVAVKSPGLPITDAQYVELQGFVTSATSTSDFVVGGQRVQTTAQTNFVGGAAADAQVGARMEVEGPLVNGVILASQISFEDSVELEANVANVTPTTNGAALTLQGLSGVTVAIDNTLTEGAAAAISNGSLTNGAHVTIRGRASGSGVVATKVEVASSPSTNVVVQAPLVSATYPTIDLLGVSIDTTGIPDSSFGGDGGVSGAASFFATVRPNDVVNVQGTLSGSSVVWNSVELDR